MIGPAAELIFYPEAKRLLRYEQKIIPKVSVVIPLYNYEDLVEQTLNSLLRQTLSEVEVVVVDDASTDWSATIAAAWCKKWSSRFACCQIFQNRRNSGLSLTRNLGFSVATAAYVFALDADNEIYPRCLERCLEVMLQSEAAAVYTHLEHFGGGSGIAPQDVWDPQKFKGGNYVDAMALIRRSAWESVGGYKKLPAWEDYDLWCKFVESGFVGVFIPEILCRYRIHPTQMTKTILDDRLKILLRHRHPWLTEL